MGLSTGFLKEVRYLPFLAPDGVVLPSLAASTVGYPLFSFTQLTKLARVARLRHVRALAEAGVGLTFTADSYSTPLVDTAAMGLVTAPIGLSGDPWTMRALNRLTGTVTNNTGSAVSNWWATWAVEWDTVPLALKARHTTDYGALTPEEQTLLEQAGLTGPEGQSTVPRDLTWIIRNEYVPHIREAVLLGQTLTVTAGANPTLFVQEARQDANEMLVLAGLAISPGSGSDGLTLMVGLDDQDDFYTTPAYPLGQSGFTPWFIQAPRLIKLQATATTTVTNVSLVAWIWHVTLTDAIRYRLEEGAAAAVADQIEVGLL